MKLSLVVTMWDNVDPTSAAKAFSELPKVQQVMSIVDEQPMEVWRAGQHVASETTHPLVKKQMQYNEMAAAAAEAKARD